MERQSNSEKGLDRIQAQFRGLPAGVWPRLQEILSVCLVVFSLILVAVAPSGAGAQSTDPVPSLMGEQLERVRENFDTDPSGDVITGTCDPAGASTINFSVTGIAVGPYPGTFSESGTFTFGPTQTLTSFTASFTIDSPAGQVTGTKTLVSGFGSCSQTMVDGALITKVSLDGSVRYEATITTASGTFIDSGVATARGSTSSIESGTNSSVSSGFSESFIVSEGVVAADVCDDDDDNCEEDDDDGDDDIDD